MCADGPGWIVESCSLAGMGQDVTWLVAKEGLVVLVVATQQLPPSKDLCVNSFVSLLVSMRGQTGGVGLVRGRTCDPGASRISSESCAFKSSSLWLNRCISVSCLRLYVPWSSLRSLRRPRKLNIFLWR